MTATITGNGIDKVQSGVIQSASLASGVPTRAQLPAGTVLQVVNATYSTQVGNSTGTLVASGLTASITPTSSTSKIFVFITNPVRRTGTVSGMNINLYRNGSSIFTPMSNMLYSNPNSSDLSVLASFSYLDSPATASSTTYAMYFASNAAGSTMYAQIDNNTATITLMEIAA